MRIALASDHAGFTLKGEIAALLHELGHETIDFGAPSTEPADLPDHVYPAALAVGRRQDVPVLAWTLPQSLVDAMAEDGYAGFLGRPDRTIPLVVEVERAAQREAVHEHASQAVPGSPLWRRLELLGDTENLVWLHRSTEVALPYRTVGREPASR